MKNQLSPCPKCKANLRDKRVPHKLLQVVAGDGWYYRTISVYDSIKDRTVAYKCPDCQHEWDAAPWIGTIRKTSRRRGKGK